MEGRVTFKRLWTLLREERFKPEFADRPPPIQKTFLLSNRGTSSNKTIRVELSGRSQFRAQIEEAKLKN